MSSKLFGGINNRSKLFIKQSTSLKEKISNIELPERFKDTIVEKWARYWKQLLIDYRDVIKDTGLKIKTNPKRSILYGTLAYGFYSSTQRNPDLSEFYDQLKTYNNEMILINPELHNENSSEYLIFLERCTNEGIIRRFSIGFLSFLWIDNYNKAVAIYKATCTHLKPEYLKFHERIIDIGFWNNWWNLNKKMIDYDINNV